MDGYRFYVTTFNTIIYDFKRFSFARLGATKSPDWLVVAPTSTAGHSGDDFIKDSS
jgi:hypothetical protein